MQFNAIANAHLVSTSGRTLAVIDPSNGQPFDTLQRSNAQDIDHAVHAARQCYDAVWCKLGAAERARLLMQLAAKVAEHTDELAALEQRDSGKPPRQARAAAQALAHRLAFYAGACDTLPGAAHSFSADGVYNWREPQGVTGHLVPWADPLPMLGRSVGAALAAGNVCVVKPSEHASLGVLRVAQLAAEAGLPAGALNIVTGQGQEAGDALVRHPGVDHIHFAGSATAGTLIQQTAAERHCPVTLELSGKSPQIVFADADLDTALPAIVHAIVHNAGQSGSAGSRVLIDALLYEPLLERLGRAFEQLRVGPAAMDLDLGPLIHARQQQRVWDFLSDAQVAGIPMVAQGQIVDEAPETGFFQVPTLLRDVPAAHRLAQDDIGGPVLCAMPFEDEDHAIELAHATRCLPAAGVWTCDGERQLRMARRLRSGQVFINHCGAGRGVELPFDENQSSGDGRNAGMETLYGFTRRKTVAVRHG